MFRLVETLPGFRIADKKTFEEYDRLVGSSYGPHALQKVWTSVWLGAEKYEHADFSFHLVNDEGNNPAIFAAAVLCILRAWKRNMRIIIGSPRGISRNIAVLATALSIDHGFEFSEGLWILGAVYPKLDVDPVLRGLGKELVRAWQAR